MRITPLCRATTSHRLRRRLSLPIALLMLTLSLACISTQATVEVTPTDDGTAQLHFTYRQELTEGYIEAARRANTDLAQDYAQAGQPVPDAGFPESWSELGDLTAQLVPDPNMVVTQEDDRGYTAEATYAAQPGADLPEGMALTVGEATDDGTQRFVLEMALPEPSDDVDVEAFARGREADLPPKPPVVAEGSDPAGEGLGGLMGAIQAVMSGTAAEAGIEGWYLQRIIKEAGLPTFTYRVTMPGTITAHTVAGEPMGELDETGSTLTLVIDEAFMRTYGLGLGPLQVTSELSLCEAQCAAQPHMIWDRAAAGPGCTCICGQGYESDDRGDCVACGQVCAAYDPLAVYDPTDSRANRCGCACTGDLLTFAWGETAGACRCVPNAERAGDDCVCATGYTKSTDGLSCIPASEAAPTTNCPAGTNCLIQPDRCQCGPGTVCDPIGGYGDPETYCSGEVAYVLISGELTPYERQWLHNKISAIRTRYRDLGYTTLTVVVNGADAAIPYLAAPSTKAVAYFGHAIEPAIEDAPAGTLRNKVYAWLQAQYAALGAAQDVALRLSDTRGKNLGLRDAYIHTCHSADTMALRDYLVAPGGTYWGETGLLFAPQSLTPYSRP